MSMERMEQVTCPHCGKQGTMQVWQSVNTAVDPETRELVRSGELFAYKCPSCGAVTNVNYGFLYHQMEDQLMIYYVTDEESCASVAEMFSGQDERMGRLMDKSGVDGYLMRIVLSQNALREKLFIFDRGLDDRVVEILKYLYISLLEKKHPELAVDTGYFSESSSGQWQVDLFGEKGYLASVELSEEQYRSLEEDLRDKLPEFRRGVFVVDAAWAEDFILEHM